MTEALDLSIFVRRQDDGTSRLDLAIEGIDCAACIDEIEGGLCRLSGIVDARLNYTNHTPSGSDWWRKRRPVGLSGC
jgi:Cu2+-exporting ATPase